jgi:hypothetical protein
MTPSERLLARLRDELGLDLPEDTVIRRTYAGYWQRSRGAWSWFATQADGTPFKSPDGFSYSVGSQYPVGRLLQCQEPMATRDNKMSYDRDISIDPCVICQRSG